MVVVVGDGQYGGDDHDDGGCYSGTLVYILIQ